MSSSIRRPIAGASIAALLAGGLMALVGAPPASPARGDDVPTVAVMTFDNSAKVPAATVDALSNALYRAASSSTRVRVVGSGPLTYARAVDGDPFGGALAAAGKSGAEQFLLGDVVRSDAGGVMFKLSAWRVEPLAIVRFQVFNAPAPLSDANALAAALGKDIQTLYAPRSARGTIFSVADGKAHADTSLSEGFTAGMRFNVLRNGRKVADATIDGIDYAEAIVAIANPVAGYKPAIGDQIVGIDPLPAAVAPPAREGFNPIWLLVGAGAIALAVSHSGTAPQPNQGSPQPSSSPSVFSVSEELPSGSPPGQVIFRFDFTKSVDPAVHNPQSDATAASFSITRGTTTICPNQPLSQLGLVTLGTGSAGPNSQLQVTSSSGSACALQPGDVVTFTFTNAIVDMLGNHLTPNTFSNALGVARHPLSRGITDLRKPIP